MLSYRIVLVTALLACMLGGCAVGTRTMAREVRAAAPEEARRHVHVFYLNSPLDRPQIGRLAAVARFTRRAGFPNATFHRWTRPDELANRITAIKQADGQARVVLVGWSGASLWCWDVAAILAPRGIVVDRIIYLDSAWLTRRLGEFPHPVNVAGVTMLYREGHQPPPIAALPQDHIARYEIPTTRHLRVAAHPRTVRHILDALVDLSRQNAGDTPPARVQ